MKYTGSLTTAFLIRYGMDKAITQKVKVFNVFGVEIFRTEEHGEEKFYENLPELSSAVMIKAHLNELNKRN